MNNFNNCTKPDEEKINSMKSQVNNEIKDLTSHFQEFEPSRNRIIVTGSMDYMRIALRESCLDLTDTFELLTFIFLLYQVHHKVLPDFHKLLPYHH